MRISPKQLLQSLLYLTPITLLALAACGGGGGSTTPGAPVITYTIGGAASGVLATTAASGLVLRLNGGNDLDVASGVASYKFSAAVVAGTPYSVTVLKHPSSPVQKCTVTSPSGTATNNVTNANVSCVGAYTITASVTNATGTGLVLQNNGGDNLLIPAAASAATQTLTFSTPLLGTDNYTVTVLAQPRTPAQDCTPYSTGPLAVNGADQTVTITCAAAPPSPLADPYVYAANFGSVNVSAYATSASGVSALSPATAAAGNGPTSIAVSPGSKFAYVTNYNSNTLSAYSIASGMLTPLASIATGTNPYSVAIHPSGKFAYVANYSSNSVSVYSIAANGALASIDADGSTTAYEASIATRSGPISIALDPSGSHAYVANAVSNDVSVYSIDPLTGALTAITASSSGSTSTYISTGGNTPNSIVVSPDDKFLYVTNRGVSNDISIFAINSAGALGSKTQVPVTPDITPVSIAIDPTSTYVYVVNSGSKNVRVYTATGSGGLSTGGTSAQTGTTPISISMDSTGQYAYVANSGSNDISVYSVAGGTLLQIICGNPSVCSGNNFQAGTTPYAVTTAK